jgi:acetate---CoA ligase (ADP-forming)
VSRKTCKPHPRKCLYRVNFSRLIQLVDLYDVSSCSKDVEFKLAPIFRNEAHRMISSIKGYKLLKGFRGRPETDLVALEERLVSLSDLVMNHPEISELDINPLRVLPKGQGTVVVDCRMILKKD